MPASRKSQRNGCLSPLFVITNLSPISKRRIDLYKDAAVVAVSIFHAAKILVGVVSKSLYPSPRELMMAGGRSTRWKMRDKIGIWLILESE